MNRAERRQLRPECRFDKLEPRELLNAHLPGPHSAHFLQVGARTPRIISGTLNGVSSFTTNPVNPATGGDAYTLSGTTSAGSVGMTGTDQWSNSGQNSKASTDAYFAGNWTMTMNNGSAVKIVYTGSGKTANSSTGPWNEALKGTAIGISGAMMNKKFSFIANGHGTNASPMTFFKFKLSP